MVKQYTDKLDGKDLSEIEDNKDKLSAEIDNKDEEIEGLKAKIADNPLDKQQFDDEIAGLEEQRDNLITEYDSLQQRLESLNGLMLQITSFGEGANIRETFKSLFDTLKGPQIIASGSRIMVIFKGSYDECQGVCVVLYIGHKDQQQEIGIYRPEQGRKFAVIDDIVPNQEYWVATRKEVGDMKYSTTPLYHIEWKEKGTDKKV